MEKKKEAPSWLGRGLSALIPPTARIAPLPTVDFATENRPNANAGSPSVMGDSSPALSDADHIEELSLDAIIPNTFQPRTVFDDAALEELAASVAAHGILQPIMVRPSGRGRYELIAGERRFRAAERAGLTRIPAIVRQMSDEDSLVVALIENIQREDLNAIEAARGYQQLLSQFHLTQTELARQLGKGLSTVSNFLRLLELPAEIQDSIAQGQISTEHGKILLSVPGRENQLGLWRRIVDQGLNTSRTYELLDKEGIVTRTKPRRGMESKDIHWQALEDQFRTALGMRIELKPGRSGKGALTIEFSTQEEVEDLLSKLNAL